MAIFSPFIHWLVNEKIDNLDFFKSLDDNSWYRLYQMLRDKKDAAVLRFLSLSSSIKLLVQGKYRSSIIKNSLKGFATNFKVTINMNIERALKVYFNFIDEEQRVKSKKENSKFVIDLLKGGVAKGLLTNLFCRPEQN